MMIKIIAVGTIKEDYYTGAVKEYSKRLNPYTKLQIVQVPDENCDDKTKKKEAASILKNIKESDYVITLEIKGKKFSSEQFAKKIEELGVQGHSDLCFVIGGSLGLDESVLSRSNLALSFSDMTFPHQLMRVILLEQIYRAFKIIRNEPYHK